MSYLLLIYGLIVYALATAAGKAVIAAAAVWIGWKLFKKLKGKSTWESSQQPRAKP